MITIFAAVAIGVVTLLRSRHESYPHQVQSYQAFTLAHAGAEFAVRYAQENADGSGNYAVSLANLIASTNGRFNLGDGAFQLRYEVGSACLDKLFSRGCSTRFRADGTCPTATREVRLEPFGGAVNQGVLNVRITGGISKIHYPVAGEPNIGYSGSRIQFSFCDYTIAYSPGNLYIPYGAVDGQYGGSGYVATIAATRDGANQPVRLGKVGFTGMNGHLLIWDAACGPCTPPSGGTFQGKLLPVWDRTSHPIPLAGEYFQIIPVPHQAWSHTRWPTAGSTSMPITDRPQAGILCDPDPGTCCDPRPGCGPWPAIQCCGGSSPPNPCCGYYYPGDTIVCIDKALSSAFSAYDRTDVTCSDIMPGSGNTSVKVQLTQGGQFIFETIGDITPPVTFYFQFPYSPCNVPGCSDNSSCGTLFPPRFITWVFTVN